jgi:Fe-S-cluster-containing dehydrogenase component
MLTFHANKCVNCQICSAVCSLRFTKQIKPSAAAIRIIRNGRFHNPDALFCNQCAEEYCINACPVGALEKDAEGIVRFNRDLCTACMVCVESCPNVAFDPETETVVICDLCDGKALCVKWCPEKAIVL